MDCPHVVDNHLGHGGASLSPTGAVSWVSDCEAGSQGLEIPQRCTPRQRCGRPPRLGNRSVHRVVVDPLGVEHDPDFEVGAVLGGRHSLEEFGTDRVSAPYRPLSRSSSSSGKPERLRSSGFVLSAWCSRRVDVEVVRTYVPLLIWRYRTTSSAWQTAVLPEPLEPMNVVKLLSSLILIRVPNRTAGLRDLCR